LDSRVRQNLTHECNPPRPRNRETMGQRATRVYGHISDSIRADGGLFVTGLALIAVCLLLAGTLLLGLRAAHRAVADFSAEPGATVYFHPRLADGMLQNLSTELRQWPGIARVTVFPAAEPRNRVRVAMENWADFLNGTGEEVCGPSLEIELKSGETTLEQTAELIVKLKQLPQADRVHSRGEWVEKTQLLVNAVDYTVAGFLTFFSILALFIIVQWIRAGMLRRSDRLEILHVLGAEPSFVVLPYHLEGTCLGAAGAIFAAALLSLLVVMCRDLLPSPLSELSLPRAWEMLLFDSMLIAWGAFLGFLGSWLAFRHYALR